MAAPQMATAALRRFGAGVPSAHGLDAGGPNSLAFAPLIFPRWKSLAEIAERQVVAPRQSLCIQAEPQRSVLVIESGVVKLVRLESDGSEFILGLRSDGWLIDAASVMLDRPAPFTAVTLTSCAVYRVSRETFLRHLESSPSLMWDFTRLVCKEIQAEREQQIELRGDSAQGRLARLLRELSGPGALENPLDLLPLKRQEIAQLLSITPEHLSRLLRG
jgi:CRP-like cAMP-binding protein